MYDSLHNDMVLHKVARLDDEWNCERRQYMLPSRHGPYVARLGMSVFWIVVGGMVGVIALRLFISAFTTGQWSILHELFPAIAFVFVAFGVYSCRRSVEYQQAYRSYKEQRARLLEQS